MLFPIQLRKSLSDFQHCYKKGLFQDIWHTDEAVLENYAISREYTNYLFYINKILTQVKTKII